MTRYHDLYQDFPRLKRPSGTDMACQFHGGLSYVDVNIMSVEAVSWPFTTWFCPYSNRLYFAYTTLSITARDFI